MAGPTFGSPKGITKESLLFIYENSNDVGSIVQLGIHLSDGLGIEFITIDFNTTDLKSDSELIKNIAFAIIKSLELNKEDIMIQDMLSDMNIRKAYKR